LRREQFGVDRSQRRIQEQAPADQYVNDDHHRQLPHSGGLGMIGRNQFFNRFPIIEPVQDWQIEALTQFVLTRQLRYRKWHEGSPSDNSSGFSFSMSDFGSLCLLLFLFIDEIILI
jgi:hypothetical protein